MPNQSDSKPRNNSPVGHRTRTRPTRSYVAPQPRQGAFMNLGDGQAHFLLPGSNQVCPECFTPINRVKAKADARCTLCKLALPINGKAKLKKKKKRDDEDEYDDREEEDE